MSKEAKGGIVPSDKLPLLNGCRIVRTRGITMPKYKIGDVVVVMSDTGLLQQEIDYAYEIDKKWIYCMKYDDVNDFPENQILYKL